MCGLCVVCFVCDVLFDAVWFAFVRLFLGCVCFDCVLFVGDCVLFVWCVFWCPCLSMCVIMCTCMCALFLSDCMMLCGSFLCFVCLYY